MALTVAQIREEYKDRSRDWIHERIADLRVLKMQAEGTGDKQSGDIIGAMVDELQAWLKQPTRPPQATEQPVAATGGVEPPQEASGAPAGAQSLPDGRGDFNEVITPAPAKIPGPEAARDDGPAQPPAMQFETASGVIVTDRVGLEALHRRDLQKLAATVGVNGRQKTSMIVDQLVALLKAEANA